MLWGVRTTRSGLWSPPFPKLLSSYYYCPFCSNSGLCSRRPLAPGHCYWVGAPLCDCQDLWHPPPPPGAVISFPGVAGSLWNHIMQIQVNSWLFIHIPFSRGSLGALEKCGWRSPCQLLSHSAQCLQHFTLEEVLKGESGDVRGGESFLSVIISFYSPMLPSEIRKMLTDPMSTSDALQKTTLD